LDIFCQQKRLSGPEVLMVFAGIVYEHRKAEIDSGAFSTVCRKTRDKKKLPSGSFFAAA
jgi:hypothetical protein